MGIIYKIKGPLNIPDECKIYVGQTILTLNKRWSNHKIHFEDYVQDKKGRYSTNLCEAVKEYNVENFNISIIEECKNEELIEKEGF